MIDPALDIEAWLAGLRLEAYAAAYRANDVDGEARAQLTGEDLKEIGVAAVGASLLTRCTAFTGSVEVWSRPQA